MITAAVAPATLSRAEGQRVSITNYGGDPSGQRDSTAALRTAMTAVKTSRASALVFPRGLYRLSETLSLNRLSDFEIDGNGSTLLIGKNTRAMFITSCSSVNVHDLAIDYDPLPFMQGTVTASGSDWFALKLDPGFTVPAHIELTALGAYDRSIKNYTQTPFEIYANAVLDVQRTGTSELRLQFKRPITVTVGTVLVLRLKLGSECVGMRNSRDVTFRRVKLQSGYSLGFSIAACSDLVFEGLEIAMPEGSNRLLSTNADGFHVTNCSGSLTIENCIFQGTGDDAININAGMLLFGQSPSGSPTALLKKSGAPVMATEDSPAVRNGDHLEVLDSHDLHIVARGTATEDFDRTLKANIEGRGSSVPDGALVVDEDLVPTTRIAGCQFRGNRARAILVHSKATITNCTFQNLSSSAILIVASSGQMEGPSTRDIVIQGSHFSGCHYGFKATEGTITIDIQSADKNLTPTDGIARNILIRDNVFESCATAAIACRSADRLVVQKNQVGPTWTKWSVSATPQAFMLSHLTNSKVTGNTSTAPNTIVVTDSTETTVSGNIGFTG